MPAAHLATTPPDGTSYPYRDCHHHPLPLREVGPDQLLVAFLAAPPGWVDGLMRTRDKIVSRWGLKTAAPDQPRPPFRSGQQLGVFRILALEPGKVLLGENDRHLDFRLCLQAGAGELRVSTRVRPHNPAGWLYLALVLPFHQLISRVMVRRMARLLAAESSS
ncbi:MAG: DUF2867 domain-containing protein [Azovibrio sp.]|nr:DUF2867 domain-containing protein [Azovibrio sp.]